jgi:16S rRNA (cytosine967-C5)-methyltransferase
MPLRFTARDLRALIEAMARSEEYKPWQVAKREGFRRYGIAGSQKDRVFTATMYRAWMLQGLLDRIVSEAIGASVEGLDAYTRAAARIYAFQRLYAHREGHEDITEWMEEHMERVLAELGGDPGVFKRLRSGIVEAFERVDRVERELLVSRFIYERVASFIGEAEARRLFEFLRSWIPPLSVNIKYDLLIK